MFRNCNCSSNDNENIEIFENTTENNIQTPSSCGFTNTSAFPQNWMYGHSYVPNQIMNQVYTPELGLKMGTIFPELVFPYCPNQSQEEINYLKSSQNGGGCNL